MGHMNYKLFLADLRARRAKLDAAISAVEDILGEAPQSNAKSEPEQRSFLESATSDQIYRDMTIAAAAIHFLKFAGKPQSTGAIVTALQRGGIPSQSKNLYRTLYNTLNNRLDKELTREGKKWGLQEWRQQ